MTEKIGQKARAGIKDVAEATGLSIATVSNALTGTRKVSDDVHIRVHAAAERLGYSANPIARAMRSGRTDVIGFISENVVMQAHGSRMLLGAQEAAAALGKILMIVDVPRLDAAIVDPQIDALIQQRVDGLILASIYHRHLTLPPALQGHPLVLLDCWDPQSSAASIVPDEERIGFEATQILHQHGHHRVAHLTIDAAGPGVDGRRRGFESAAEQYHLHASTIAVTGPADTRAGRDATAAVLNDSPDVTGVFCFNDQMAMGAYQAAAAAGRRIPTDLSVIGVDDLPLIASELQPPLSTIALPHYEMGANAVRLLMSDGLQAGASRLPGTTLERNSVAMPRSRPPRPPGSGSVTRSRRSRF